MEQMVDAVKRTIYHVLHSDRVRKNITSGFVQLQPYPAIRGGFLMKILLENNLAFWNKLLNTADFRNVRLDLYRCKTIVLEHAESAGMIQALPKRFNGKEYQSGSRKGAAVFKDYRIANALCDGLR
jgi:hypothetical protein